MNGQILGTGTITGGSVTISFHAVSTADTIFVTLTAFNKVPYEGIVLIVPTITDVHTPAPAVSSGLSLYPNPSNGLLYITYNLDEAGYTSLQIFNSIGQEVKSLGRSETQAAGNHQATINTSALD